MFLCHAKAVAITCSVQKNALRFADMSQHFFCGIARAKVATYNHFKVYDVCSFHSG